MWFPAQNFSKNELSQIFNCNGNDVLVGGAIISTNSTINISHSKFEDNRATIGGAIFAEKRSIVYMSESVFIGNHASMGGGVLCSFFSTFRIKASEFHNNTIKGGLIHRKEEHWFYTATTCSWKEVIFLITPVFLINLEEEYCILLEALLW